MTDHDAFDSSAYLHTFYGDVGDQRARHLMNDVFQSLQERKELDFGSGPVIQNSISAAAFATAIVFCDISSANREAARKWLN